jgi:hypothetical protein
VSADGGDSPEPDAEMAARHKLRAAIEEVAEAEARHAHSRANQRRSAVVLSEAEAELAAFANLDEAVGLELAELFAEHGAEVGLPQASPELLERKRARDETRDRVVALRAMVREFDRRTETSAQAVKTAQGAVRSAQGRVIEAVLGAYELRFVELDREAFILRSLMAAIVRVHLPGPDRPRPITMQRGVLEALTPRVPEDIQVKPYSEAITAFREALAADPGAAFVLPRPWGSPR